MSKYVVRSIGDVKLLDKADQLIRTAYFDEEGEEDKEFAMDYIWYMWCGPKLPCSIRIRWQPLSVIS
ncbi:fructose-1,6-bisphosphatase [Parabacteroides johnsonii]|nr:fructose-1,6-bisphosphatase [Parabacteroides johnsonii]